MSLRPLLLVVLPCLIYSSEASDILKGLPQAEVILQKFLDLVEENQLNVSIVTSRTKLWSNGQLQELKDNALLMPPNNVQLTESKLTQSVGKQWLADLQPWTSKGKVIATYRTVSFDQNGVVSEQLAESSNLAAVPTSPSLQNILTPEIGILKGLIPQNSDYEIKYNFLVSEENGQSQNVEVYAVYLNITIVDQSKNILKSEINKMKAIIPKIWMMFDDDKLLAKYIVESLNDAIPLTNSTWQVIIGTDNFYVPSGKWVILNISNVNIVIFSLAK